MFIVTSSCYYDTSHCTIVARHSWYAQWRSQGFDPGGHEHFFGGAIYILDSGTESAKWATEARSPSIGLSELNGLGKHHLI